MYGLNDDATSQELQGLLHELLALKQKIRDVRQSREPRPAPDHELTAADGSKVRLADLFGDKRYLVIVHNMGFGCPYCTMWADGFNGLYAHLAERFAFYIVSPDTPEQQAAGAAARGWTMPMLSSRGSEFTNALGFETDAGGQTQYMPGASTFTKDEQGKVWLLNQTPFGPGDDFNPVFAFADMVPPQ